MQQNRPHRVGWVGSFLAIVLALAAVGVAAFWVGNYGNRPSYGAMSHFGEEQYQPPHDTGVLVVANGFYARADQRRGAPKATLFIPYWLLILLAAPWPVWRGRQYLVERARRGREARGLCWGCGYDLRITPERCPECGSVPRRSFAQGHPAASKR
jgi:hypothetical protein